MTATSGTDALPLSRTAWVTDQIREAILGGEIEPGTLIRHRELEARYGVSATPVREAIQRLAAERLLLATPQRGAQVAPYDPVELGDIYQLRLLLEPMATGRSVTRADGPWQAKVQESFLAMEEAEPVGPKAWFDAHNQFHSVIRSRCDSPWTLRFIDDLVLHTERYRRLIKRQPERSRPRAEHAELVRACLAGDGEHAADVMKRHLEGTLDFIRQCLAADPADE